MIKRKNTDWKAYVQSKNVAIMPLKPIILPSSSEVMNDHGPRILNMNIVRALCNVHHLRDLKESRFCEEQWAQNMKKQLFDFKWTWGVRRKRIILAKV